MESGITVMTHVADLSPALAVIVADPALTAVTLPFSTLAISVSDELQFTVLSVALFGETVAVSVSLPPSMRVKVVLFSETEDTDTTLGGFGLGFGLGFGFGVGSGCSGLHRLDDRIKSADSSADNLKTTFMWFGCYSLSVKIANLNNRQALRKPGALDINRYR